MGKIKKSFIGVATLLAVFFLCSFSLIAGYESTASQQDTLYIVSIILGILTMLYFFVMVGFYCSFVIDSAHIAKKKKVIWIICILLFHIIAMPVFWFVHIWNAPEKET